MAHQHDTPSNDGANDTLEKDFSAGNSHGPTNNAKDDALERIRTAGSISIPPELFEKLYLSPENRVSGDLRKTFGNPTPLALIGFVLSLTPLSCDLMGWRGAGGTGAASTGAYFGFGGLLMILGSIGEWILGNTFPFVVFGTYGAFWIALASTLVPWFNAYGAYVSDPTEIASQAGNPGNPFGLQTPAFNASFAFFFLFLALISLIFLIGSLRTNIAFFLIFFTLVGAFASLAGAYWSLALAYENPKNTLAAHHAARLVVAGGAFAFVTSLSGWYLIVAILLAELDFPVQLPVGDLSWLIRGKSERAKAKDAV
ncbi:hypothetical protein JMJ35_009765 [Cladonia borealis]|uniref:GPR1/FUN34/YaaH-class plasma membrane protein n=1 Tax=Cladonia borealis TaxID=184061 RepID=A0AA39QU25_9LECA|nr:hypothetical protein JMJ35_009765 [Cladonia borealis]